MNAPIFLGLFSRKPYGDYALQFSIIISIFFAFQTSKIEDILLYGSFAIANLIYFSNRKGYWGIGEDEKTNIKDYKDSYFIKVDNEHRYSGLFPYCNVTLKNKNQEGNRKCPECHSRFNFRVPIAKA